MSTVFLVRRTTALVGRFLVWTWPVRCGFWAGYRLQVYKHVIKAIRRPSDLKLQFIYMFYYDFVIFADTMPSCVACNTNVSVHQHALECDVCRQWTTFCCAESDGYTFLVLVQGRKFQGAKVPPMILSLLGAKVRLNESSIIRNRESPMAECNSPTAR